MVSVVLSILLLVSGVGLIPTTQAEDCTSYWDDSGVHRDGVSCGGTLCCGSCHSKYCCSDHTQQLTGEQQEGCDDGRGSPGPPSAAELGGGASWQALGGRRGRKRKRNSLKRVGAKTAVLLGSILGSIIPLIFCVGLVVCFVAPCCFLYKKCRKVRNSRRQNVPTTTFIAVRQQPAPPAQHPPSHPSYQPVPVQPGYGGPALPTAPPPPPYMEAAPPAFPQPSLPPYPGHDPQPPYNPSFGFVHT
ncbi:protein shisa-4-like [Dunckerocampus dactyliophorus]|uniref:protein shisa-4-like n=1 Tax=Dunckerocampus dactyliophorus TaxID=161453 RepID=UPI0024069284|nr:protein shisa-4-like [Dunckerocampus dactyliophorus]